MKNCKVLAIAFGLVLSATVLLPIAQGSDWDEMTKLVFNSPVEIPGTVLPAGTYWFVLLDGSDRNVVQIYSPDWSKVYATVLTMPTYRTQATDQIELRLVERPRKGVEALQKWYFPGRMTGHEFVYSRKVERRLANDPKEDILAAPIYLSSRLSKSAP
jgi:hypothetical protein